LQIFATALLEVAWHRCFAKYTEVGKDRGGEKRVGSEKEKKGKSMERN